MWDWLRKIFETKKARAERLLQEHLEAEKANRLYWDNKTPEQKEREIRLGLRPYIVTDSGIYHKVEGKSAKHIKLDEYKDD